MASSKEEAKFSLVLEDNVSGAADSAADSLDHLRQRISGGEDAIKNMRSAFNRLRGSTDEVKAAKGELVAKLNAERDAISSASVALMKSGGSYDAAKFKAKKLAAEGLDKARTSTDGLASSMKKAKPEANKLDGGLAKLKESGLESGGGMKFATTAAMGLIGAAIALAAALVSTMYSLGKWIVMTADAERSANLLREAWSGTAKNAGNLGSQVDLLSEKVPTSTEELNKLAIALMKSKLGGQATVDTLNAVGQASAALGDEAGGKIKEFIERGRLMGRMRIDPSEMLEGFGNLNFDDVAKALAKNTNKSVEAARLELRQGKTKLGDGAKAMRDAVEARFGDINLRKMMSVSGLAETLQKKFGLLTRDVKLEPLLQGLDKLVGLFDTSTQNGAALKAMITAFGNASVSILTKAIPFVSRFMDGLIIGALDVGIAVLTLRNSLKKTFGDTTLLEGIDWMNVALTTGKLVVGALAGTIVMMAAGVALAIAPFVAMYEAWSALNDLGVSIGTTIKKFFVDTDWAASGKAIVDGIIAGLTSGATALVDTVKGLAERVKGAFTGKMEIHSPSRVFKGYGKNTVEGYADGVEESTPMAARALGSMAEQPGGGSGKASASAGGITVQFTYVAAPGGGGDIAAQVQEPAVRAALMRLLQEAFLGAGIPVSA